MVSVIVAVQTGSLAAQTSCGFLPDAERMPVKAWTRQRVRAATLVLLLIAMACCIFCAIESLKLFRETLTVGSFLSMAARWTVLRYGGYVDPWPMRLAAIWLYPPALLGGVMLPISEKRSEKVLSLATLLPTLLFTMYTGGRAAFLVGLACWLGGYWASRVGTRAEEESSNAMRTGMLIVIGVLSMLLLFVAVNAFRGVEKDGGSANVNLQVDRGQVVNYFFGSPVAFARWYVQGDRHPLSLGSLTFPSAFDLLHIKRKTLGTYTASEQTTGSEGTNIFTIFRGLIEDFSLLGTFVLCLSGGFAITLSYCRRSLTPRSLLGLGAFYALALFSPLYCIFGFNGPIFAWMLAAIVLTFRRPFAAVRTATAGVV